MTPRCWFHKVRRYKNWGGIVGTLNIPPEFAKFASRANTFSIITKRIQDENVHFKL